MNKKLFSWKALAGFALLAAVSMTSCNTDDPINPTNPSGVNPTASSHYVGGDYDWTAIAKNLTELQKFWIDDQPDVVKLLTNNKAKTANILIDVSGFELDNTTIFTLPDFWGSGANGNVVNITFRGNFKKADYQRASAIAGDGKAFPVKIVTDNLAGAEVNFIFDAEKFDLELSSKLTRSTLSGDYKIGYMKADAAEKLSALEVKSGTIEAMDVESTGDYKGSIGGVWTKTKDNEIFANSSGLYANIYDDVNNVWNPGITISGAKNIFVEKDAVVFPQYYNASGDCVDYALGTVKFVQKSKTPATISMTWTGYNNPSYTIESIEGIGAEYSFVRVGQSTLDDVDAVKNVEITGYPTLKKDVFTDVVFNWGASFNTKDVKSFDKVTFENARIFVGADNTDLTFNGVTFNSVAVLSSIDLENISAYYTYKYYQWVISGNDPSQGKWVIYKDDNDATVKADIKEYNKNKEIIEFDDTKAWVDANGDLKNAWGVDVSSATNLIKIGHFNDAYVVQIIPEGTTFTFDKDCKFWNSQLGKADGSDYALNRMFGHKSDSKDCWYSVTFADKAYSWRRVNYGGTTVYWDLIPPTAE